MIQTTWRPHEPNLLPVTNSYHRAYKHRHSITTRRQSLSALCSTTLCQPWIVKIRPLCHSPRFHETDLVQAMPLSYGLMSDVSNTEWLGKDGSLINRAFILNSSRDVVRLPGSACCGENRAVRSLADRMSDLDIPEGQMIDPFVSRLAGSESMISCSRMETMCRCFKPGETENGKYDNSAAGSCGWSGEVDWREDWSQ